MTLGLVSITYLINMSGFLTFYETASAAIKTGLNTGYLKYFLGDSDSKTLILLLGTLC
jgi:hypothetical protein